MIIIMIMTIASCVICIFIVGLETLRKWTCHPERVGFFEEPGHTFHNFIERMNTSISISDQYGARRSTYIEAFKLPNVEELPFYYLSVSLADGLKNPAHLTEPPTVIIMNVTKRILRCCLKSWILLLLKLG